MRSECIKKEDAVEAVWKILNGMGYSEKHNDRLVEEVDAILDDIPAADVRPVVRGKWVEMFDSDGYPARNHWLCCSICGHVAPFGRMSDTESHTNYCPNCGADMREES